ncbi:putative J domain-containing protein C63.13 [Rhodotorula toruloides]|nr:putative J domain-containing protein C63.13 [Rhodotorula toruloides]
MSQTFPDYYAILGVSESATFDQIKTAYKRKSLQCHPDRVPPGPSNDARRRAATVEFQAVADAHYTLSDPHRRQAYDELRQANRSRWTDAADDSGNFWSFFGGGAGTSAAAEEEPEERERPDAEHVFGNVFEDMLRPEVNRVLPLWTWSGAAAGAVIGFIAGNLPGAAIGAFGGSKLGAIRDAKGKSVYSVFKDLPQTEKAEVLAALAKQVFGMSGLGRGAKN